MDSVLLILLSTILLVCLKTYIDVRRAVRGNGNRPGFWSLVSCFGTLGFMFKEPRRGLTGGSLRFWRRRHLDFDEAGVDILTHISFIPNVRACLVLADAAAIKEVTSSRLLFPKPPYPALRVWGGNIIASDGEEWKRHRKVSAPAFSEPNNRLVWTETVKIMLDLFDNVWGSQDTVTVDHVVDSITLPVALFVISVAGFGKSASWQSDLLPPPGHKLSFKDALHVVSVDMFIQVACPKLLWKFAPTKRIANVKLAYEELEQYMLEMVQDRRKTEKKEERYDLFSSLLDASDSDSDVNVRLTDRELLGNIFIFMLAGHETTAHSLAFTFGLLAMHQDYQEKLYQHIKGVIPDDRLPTYEDMNKLTECTAVFYETLRLFPPVVAVPKVAAEDTSLVTTDFAGNKVVIPVPRGQELQLAILALHYNPRYWDDPHAFKPERFHGDWPRDAFLPFSAGARACLGRRFFETEGIAILTMLVSRYKIELRDEPEFANETYEERWQRLFEVKQGITLAPAHLPLVFKRR
ncbi:cytochrome P450 [Phanerochaete sordida]|uniref:Cytochrome P450 n=1 Tax=Phanerochaete sordida TaxID=48140 RepID=A0A9P3GKC5_9APHY|nr:cytochrome P450 [Phanerochaete sordida]